MVEQLRAQGVENERVLQAMNKIPRHLFVEEALWEKAYELCSLPLPGGQSISHPLTVARMTELLDLEGEERVLEVGTGSGYQSAVLAELCEKVFSVECRQHLLVEARRRLETLGYYNILIKLGNGSEGWAEKGPFDAVIVTAGAESIPQRLVQQLAEGGRLIVPVGSRKKQEILLLRKIGGKIQREKHFSCNFVALVR